MTTPSFPNPCDSVLPSAATGRTSNPKRRSPARPLAIAAACLGLGGFLVPPAPAYAQEAAAVAPLMRLLKSGRVPAARLGTFLEKVGQQGEADDLAYLFGLAAKPDGLSPELRKKALELLVEAAATRKVKPSGDLGGLQELVVGEKVDPETRALAVQLAAAWKVESLAAALQKAAADPKSPLDLRKSALDGLAEFGTPAAKATIAELAAKSEPLGFRYRATAALARLDSAAGAEAAAAALAVGDAKESPAELLSAFLARKDGPDKLAAALGKVKLTQDVAKTALRLMYAQGRSDAKLSDELSKQAGVASDPPPPTPADIKKLAEEVLAKGDASRGEQIFRRAELSCNKCHAISQAGGQVGPDLSAVGAISPADFVVTSILLPDAAIKEAYITKVIATVDGEVFTGIQIDRDDQRVKIRDATGKEIVVAIADIEEEAEGKSLMPKGLVKFLTHQEFLDLARFISELGKPGPYAINTQKTINRWRVLRPVPPELAAEVPNVEIVRAKLIDAPADRWQPAYALVAGDLPLAELAEPGQKVLYLQNEVEVLDGGPFQIVLDSAEGVTTWVQAEPFEGVAAISRDLPPGKYKILYRVDLAKRSGKSLKVSLKPLPGSPARFQPVVGS